MHVSLREKGVDLNTRPERRDYIKIHVSLREKGVDLNKNAVMAIMGYGCLPS